MRWSGVIYKHLRTPVVGSSWNSRCKAANNVWKLDFRGSNAASTNMRSIAQSSRLWQIDNKKDKEQVLVRVFEQGKTLPHQQWTIRMNNQNGFLSWCRNSYLCLSVSVGITMSQKFMEPSTLTLLEGSSSESYATAAYGLLGLAYFNLVYGSLEFAYQLVMTRTLTQISWLTIGIYLVFVIVHAALFLRICGEMLPAASEDDQKEL